MQTSVSERRRSGALESALVADFVGLGRKGRKRDPGLLGDRGLACVTAIGHTLRLCEAEVRVCWGRGSPGPLLFVSISGPNLHEVTCHKSVQLWGCEAWSLGQSGGKSHTGGQTGRAEYKE